MADSGSRTRVKFKRRIPHIADLSALLKSRKPILYAKKRRLSRALTICDLHTIAKRRTPQAPFDYTDGSADQEISLDRAGNVFQEIEFIPNVLRDVSKVDATVMMLD